MRILSLLLMCSLAISAGAQEVWNLQRCIEQAWSANLSVRQSELNLEASESQLQRTNGNMLPNLNGFGSHNYNWGQRIDPFTNQFATTRVQSNSFGLSSDLTLFNGFQNQQARLAQQDALRSSEYDLETQKNNIALAVSSAYLNVIMTEELIDVAEQQVVISKNQSERMQKLVEAGNSNLAAQYELEAQLARDRATLVQRTNDHLFALLQLKQILVLPADQGLSIQKPNVALEEKGNLENASTVYNMAEGSMPEVKSAEYSLSSSDRSLAQAKGGWYPSLSLSGSIGSGYSGLRTEVVDVTQSGTTQIGLTTSGERVIAPTFETAVERVAFTEQLSDNFNQFVGLSLNVPIFNRFAVKNSVEQARIGRSIAEVQYEQVKQDLRQRIEQARFDAEAARETYAAAESAAKSSQQAFQFASARFEAGAMNVMEFNNSKSNLQIAESQVLQAKYDFLFRIKVLDFYMGKPLSF